MLDKNTKNALLYAKRHEGVGGQDGSVYMLIAASIAGDDAGILSLAPTVKALAKNHGGDPLRNTRQWVQSPEIITALEAELKSIGITAPAH